MWKVFIFLGLNLNIRDLFVLDGPVCNIMTNWMKRMAIGGASSTLVSMPSMASLFSASYKKPISLSFVISFFPSRRLSLSLPAASFSALPSINDDDNASDFGDHLALIFELNDPFLKLSLINAFLLQILFSFLVGDGDLTAVSRKGSKLPLKGMTYSELEVCLFVQVVWYFLYLFLILSIL